MTPRGQLPPTTRHPQPSTAQSWLSGPVSKCLLIDELGRLNSATLPSRSGGMTHLSYSLHTHMSQLTWTHVRRARSNDRELLRRAESVARPGPSQFCRMGFFVHSFIHLFNKCVLSLLGSGLRGTHLNIT